MIQAKVFDRVAGRMHISETWITTIVGGTVAAVLAGFVLYMLLPSHPVSQETTMPDVVGTQPCTRSDGGPGLMGTHDGRAYCFATRKKRHTAE
jgi:hypothetical protein